MGAAMASLRATGQQQALRRKLPPPPNSQEVQALTRIAGQEMQRMKQQDMPSVEELGRKDTSLDTLLVKLSGAIGQNSIKTRGIEEPPQPVRKWAEAG